MPQGRLMSDLEWDLTFEKQNELAKTGEELMKPMTFVGERLGFLLLAPQTEVTFYAQNNVKQFSADGLCADNVISKKMNGMPIAQVAVLGLQIIRITVRRFPAHI